MITKEIPTKGIEKKQQNSIKMDKLWVLVLVTLSWIFQSECFRSDLIQPSRQQGCIWSMENSNSSTQPKNKHSNGFSLDCNLRTLNVDFWNYTFNRDQVEHTSKLDIKCNDKLFFESFLSPNQSQFQLVNLKEISIHSCKIRKMPYRIWLSLGSLQSLSLTSQNGKWSSSVGLEIEAGSFEGLGKLESLNLSENNIWSLHKNIFCPLKSLLTLNLSRNRLSDIEELAVDNSSRDLSSSNNDYCALSVQNLDLSTNNIRRLSNNAFSRMRKLIELRLQNNMLQELDDFAFGGLGQMRLLNLSSNRLVALPPSIFRQNPSLREINLSNNSISALSPQVFSGLETLLSLDLSRNTLTSQWIKGDMFNGLRRLVILKLSLNNLSYIDGSVFKDLTSLQGLFLDGNKIESVNPDAFTSLKNLHHLDFSKNRLTFIDAKVFSNLFVLTQLYLDHNKIGEIDANSLRNCSSLQDLGLSNNFLKEVPIALRAPLNNLVTLDIGENEISVCNNESFTGLTHLYGLRMVENKLTELPNGFCGGMKKLRILNLSNNRINKISSTSFTSCSQVRVLRLDNNALDELTPTLTQQLPNLLWLNASMNVISYNDYHQLPQSLEWLSLSSNSIVSLGGLAPSSERTHSTKQYNLRVLLADDNQLTSLDYTTIPPSLELLSLKNNTITSIASDTFAHSTRLRQVFLSGNQLENLQLSSLRIPTVPMDKPFPEFQISNPLVPFVLSCSMEWLTRVNQLTLLRTYPKITDLDNIVLRPTFSRPNQLVPLAEAKPSDFLCPYKSHCFSLCTCCEYDACDCSMTCPDACTCRHDTAWSVNIVECSNINYTQIPPRIPMDVTTLYLDGNNISQLGSHIFIGKRNMKTLYLNDSKVEVIKNKTFNGLKSLEVLQLQDNLISELRGYEFIDLDNLKELYLQNNVIRFIHQNTFGELKLLQVLRLDMNLIVEFDVSKLSVNSYLNSVMLAGNPWSCDCEFLIPFRTWVASKAAIVADFTLANCQSVNSTHVLTGSSSSSTEMDFYNGHAIIPKDAQNRERIKRKLYPIHMQHPISSMCNHNSELNFNFDPIRAVESDIMNNHISAMAGGAEKVTISDHTDREIQFGHVDSAYNVESMNTFWSLLLGLTTALVLIIVIVAIFRKEIYYWIYTHVCGQGIRGRSGGKNALLSLLCCGENGGKNKRSSSGRDDESDKLFDAYFIYSRATTDSEILLEKIAPELESSQGSANFRICLHYRDLCLNADNPFNTEMVESAADASKRVILVLSKMFIQSELSNSNFRQAIQSVINRHQKKLILILLPPFNEQNLSTIYPELKNSSQVKSSTLEWSDKNFWLKMKLILPTPSNINTFSTIGRNRRGSSLLISGQVPAPLIDLGVGGNGSSNNSNASGTMSSYTINRLDFPYSSNNHHQYHRNILPYQIPISNCSTLNPPIPKHHIALTTPSFYHHHQAQTSQPTYHAQSQQNFSIYNGGSQNSSQHYFLGGNNNLQNFLPVPHQQGSVVYPMSTLPHSHQPQHFSFNESFRRHLQERRDPQQQQLQNPVFAKHTGNNGVRPGYQPLLDPNYSSSAVSSSAEELEHVYSTLDSPLQSPNTSVNTTTTNICSPTSSGSAHKLGSSNQHNANSSQSENNNTSQQVGTNGQMYFV